MRIGSYLEKYQEYKIPQPNEFYEVRLFTVLAHSFSRKKILHYYSVQTHSNQ